MKKSLLSQPYNTVQELALQAFIKRNNPRPGIEQRLSQAELQQMVVEFLQLQLAKEQPLAVGVEASIQKSKAILAEISQAFPQLLNECHRQVL